MRRWAQLPLQSLFSIAIAPSRFAPEIGDAKQRLASPH
jgi:hypothetical protein